MCLNQTPYEELLERKEWKDLREKIIQRDKFCCTKCGKTKSNYKNNENLYFQTRDRLICSSIIYQNKSLDDIKKELKIKTIQVISINDLAGGRYGLSDNNDLFLVDWDRIKDASKSDLVVFSGKTKLGHDVLILGKRGFPILEYSYFIPLISKERITMHVHHKFYIKEKLPWEYNHDALITLCNWCHAELHEQTIVPVYTLVDGELRDLNYTPCNRCHGAGVLPEYKHVQNGVCFKCNGSRYEELMPPTLASF